jgi:SAM-dependent methyltransferase
MIAVLFPRFDHPAIEERYSSWQSETILREQADEFLYYDSDQLAGDIVQDIDATHVAVVTDPLILASRSLLPRLRAALGSADAVLPVTNKSDHPAQLRTPPGPYMTLRELEAEITVLEAKPPSLMTVTWDRSDPGLYLCERNVLEGSRFTLPASLEGRTVLISGTDYVHRWSSMRGQVRVDLLDRISPSARNILEFGCGEAPLGAALKARQQCRVVGVELDRAAAAVARRRIDDVYNLDVRELVRILDERFDWIIGGDIVEHLDDPWTFLEALRRLAQPGGRLLLSLPNLSNASVIGDLLAGRFDYVYMGLTCVGHLRFFTRRTIEDLLHMSGWKVVEIAPQDLPVTPQAARLVEALSAAGVPYSAADLTASGYYVIAENG